MFLRSKKISGSKFFSIACRTFYCFQYSFLRLPKLWHQLFSLVQRSGTICWMLFCERKKFQHCTVFGIERYTVTCFQINFLGRPSVFFINIGWVSGKKPSFVFNLWTIDHFGKSFSFKLVSSYPANGCFVSNVVFGLALTFTAEAKSMFQLIYFNSFSENNFLSGLAQSFTLFKVWCLGSNFLQSKNELDSGNIM